MTAVPTTMATTTSVRTANGRWPLVIIGAGPGGLEAAATAAEHGVECLIIDAHPRPGGHYYKQLPDGFYSEDRTRRQTEAEELGVRLTHPHIHYRPDTVTWGIFPSGNGDWELAIYGPGEPNRVIAEFVVLANGAYDRPVAFPGWTLPGVMTAGGVQTLLKSQRVLPGKRFLMSGTGPLQLAVAATVIRAGGEVVAVLEGSQVGWGLLRGIRAAWGQWMRLAEGLDFARVLRSAHVSVRRGWSVIAAEGEDQVEAAVIARLDRDWQPVAGSEQRVQVDTIVTGYGFVPVTELSRLADCEHVYRPEWGGWVPVRNSLVRTSRAGVYAIGDAAGIAGALAARLEGQIAGLDVARRLAVISDSEHRIAAAQRSLTRERQFAGILAQLFSPRQGLDSLATSETVICRCEGVTFGQIRRAVRDGARTAGEVKGVTCAGMGDCQGRICGTLLPRLLAREFAAMGLTLPSVPQPFSVRPPIHPVPLASLAELM